MSSTIRSFALALVTAAMVAGCANRSGDPALMPPPDDSWSPAINVSATAGGPPQPSAASAAPAPRDPWPRDVTLTGADALIYQPQVDSWTGNVLAWRVAIALRPTGAKNETFGVVWGTARTDVDRVT